MASSPEIVLIPGSERKPAETSKHIEQLPDDEDVSVTLIIRHPADGPPVPDLEYWQNTPVTQQQFISPQDYIRSYGASSADLDQVHAFANENGLIVVNSHAGRRTVTVKGTAKQMNAAFGVKLQRYESPVHQKRGPPTDTKTYVHRGFEGLVSVPRNLAGIITGVVGLDDRRIVASHVPSGDPPDSMALLAPTVAGYYNFPNAGASDQVIGLVEFEPVGYLETDFSKFYFPSMPPGYDTLPQINSVSVAAATNEGISTPNAYENLVDIAVAGTVAQGATINVYFAPGTEAGFIDVIARALVPGTEVQPTVLSISYAYLDDGIFGSPTTPGTFVNILTNIFQHLAYQGINVFVSAGDAGASNYVSGLHVAYPSSDPWITSCGGSILGNASGSPPVFQEWVWNDNVGATGGGSSSIFPIPPYQLAAGITGIKDSSGTIHTNRFIPDISGMNEMTGFFIGGNPIPKLYGTSLVAPLYAGLTAVVRSALGIRLGLLNSILYPLGNVIFNDITQGNNDSGIGSPYFIAGPGFDACSGWGSLDGTKFLNALVKMYFLQRLYFEVDQDVFDLEQVKHISSYPAAFKLVLEGVTPNALGTQQPTLDGHFVGLPGVKISIGPPTPENPSKPFTPQRISYTCGITFNANAIHTIGNGGVFPLPGERPVHKSLGAKINVLGETVVAQKTEFKLEFDYKEHESTGKVTGLIYDRFGDFEGFILSTEAGKEKIFRNGEKTAEGLIRLAWEKRILITVLIEGQGHPPRSIILRSLPHP